MPAASHLLTVTNGQCAHEPAAEQRNTSPFVTAPLIGLACGQVFVYKTHGSYNRNFFQSADTWLPVSQKERRHYPESKHCLKEVMEYFLMDDPAAKVRFPLFSCCTEVSKLY